MKIVHICLGSFFIDNYSYQENILPKYHKKMGFEVTVIASLVSFNKSGKPCFLLHESQNYTADGIKIIRVDYKAFIKPINRILRRYNNVFKLLKEESPDIIFIHGGQFLDVKYVVKYVKKYPNVRVVADFHSDYQNSGLNWISKNILHRYIWKIAIKRVEPFLIKIYCITPGVKKFIKESYNLAEDKIELLPLAADDEVLLNINYEETRMKIRKELNVTDRDIVIIHGGKLDKNKRTIELIEAIQKMPDNIHLIIFGNSEPKYENQIKTLSNGDSRIHLIGWIDQESVYSYFIAADVACFSGGQSVLWQQAIASGLPLVCRYWYGADYLDVGGNVLFLPESTSSLIYNGLNLLVNNPELIKSMSEVAKTKGRDYFSYKRIAKKVVNDVL